MTVWQLARTRRWLGYLALVVVFAVVCCALGMWQFARRAEARAEIERVENNYDSQPVAIDEVLPELGAFDEDDEWLPVRVTGTYLVDEQLLARARPLEGDVGFEVLTPLLLENGSVLVVDRGWIPTGTEGDEPDAVPAPPRGEVTVTARIKPGEPLIAGRSAPEGQIATIHLPDLAERLDRPTYTGAYGLLVSEDPAVEDMPTAATRPEPDEGPHLSYALQWFVFAIMGFFALGWALRQEHRALTADPDAPPVPSRRKRATDAEVEDAILDAG